MRDGFGTYAAHLLLDDLQLDKCDTMQRADVVRFYSHRRRTPTRWRREWFASYTRVTNLAYRTPNHRGAILDLAESDSGGPTVITMRCESAPTSH